LYFYLRQPIVILSLFLKGGDRVMAAKNKNKNKRKEGLLFLSCLESNTCNKSSSAKSNGTIDTEWRSSTGEGRDRGASDNSNAGGW